MADSSVKGLMKDKRVQLAAAGVGGVGLLVLLMRRGGGAPAGGGTVIQPAAGLDSSGSDLYNAMQQLGQGWQNDIRNIGGQLTNVQDKLDKMPTGGTGAQPTPTGPTKFVFGGTSIAPMMKEFGFTNYNDFWKIAGNDGAKVTLGPDGKDWVWAYNQTIYLPTQQK